jgi:hypothetical protein
VHLQKKWNQEDRFKTNQATNREEGRHSLITQKETMKNTKLSIIFFCFSEGYKWNMHRVKLVIIAAYFLSLSCYKLAYIYTQTQKTCTEKHII